MSTRRAHPGPSATIVAFDGVIADTLDTRASVLDDALAAVSEQLQLRLDRQAIDSRQVVAGRTFAEAARDLLSALPMGFTDDAPPLETLVDLVAADAGRRYANALSDGISLCPGAGVLLAALASSGKVIARADSPRRDVDAMLSLAGLDGGFTFVRCSDDAPREIGASSLRSSWIAIDRRLTASGVASENRTAVEVDERAMAAARTFAALVRRPTLQEGNAGETR